MTVKPVRYPNIREDVHHAISVLANREYQDRVWVRGILPAPGVWVETMESQVDALYDATDLLSEPDTAVGIIIYASEIPFMRALDASLGPIIDELRRSSERAYAEHPDWPSVVRAAETALEHWVPAGVVDEDG